MTILKTIVRFLPITSFLKENDLGFGSDVSLPPSFSLKGRIENDGTVKTKYYIKNRQLKADADGAAYAANVDYGASVKYCIPNWGITVNNNIKKFTICRIRKDEYIPAGEGAFSGWSPDALWG